MKFSLYLLLILLPLSACTDNHAYKYRIGVSQCVGGKWREKVNDEMLSAQHLYGNEVKVDIANASHDTHKQIQQIDSLVASGVDLLVVAPNEYSPIAPAIVRAKKRGTPVVLFDRKARTNDYTAYIGGDNAEAGRAMGHYALSLLRERNYDHSPLILEITGGTNSSPAIDRHRGFSGVMGGRKGIDYRFVNTDWTSEAVYHVMSEWLTHHSIPDIVFCHSDLATRNAYKAALKHGVAKKILFLGIDGLPGKGEGIDAVERGLFAGTYIYPTHGEKIVKLALDILQGHTYKRENIMRGTVVTPDNAALLQQASMEMSQQSSDLLILQDKLENYFGLYNTQRMITLVSVSAIVLLVIALVLIWRVVVITRRLNRREKQINREQTLFYTNARHQLRTPLTLIEGPVKALSGSATLQGDERIWVNILQRNVEQLAHIVYDVLNFTPDTIEDKTNDSGQKNHLSVSDSNASVQSARLELLTENNDNTLPTVLIVDDNEDMRRYLRTLLTGKYYVVEAADGESGLLVGRDTVPDLIVSDVMMPVMDGLQFCRKVKDDPMTSHIPVILLTARSTESQQVEGFGSGADAYMTKPFSANLLLARIDNLLKNRAHLRHLFDGKSQEETEEQKLTSPDREFISRFKSAVLKHLSENNLKMEDLGAEMGISRIQLYRKVKALTGFSPADLLKQMRLQKALSLLKHSSLSVSEIAYNTGFSSPGYFSTCFKKQYDKYPTDIRAHH